MSRESPPRDATSFVSLFQKAHAKVTALQRLDDQIAALCVQHKRLQDDVKAIQAEIAEAFSRVLRYNQAPAKLPEALNEGGTNGSDQAHGDLLRHGAALPVEIASEGSTHEGDR